jgi:hypothetical protein
MNDPAAKDAFESVPRPNRKRILASLAVFAMVMVVVLLALFFAGTDSEDSVSETVVATEQPSEQEAELQRLPRPAPTEEGADVAAPEAAPTPPARSSETPTGIHVFPPLGTRPKLVGLVVPDDFELPPGYVRHYQSTDDGRRLAPILMFDPVRPPLDEFGEPVDIPPDRIVPPEMAPEGMPIIMLELPEPTGSDSSSLRGLLRSG